MSQHHDRRGQSLYLDADLLKEMRDEATRQGRSLSWMAQRAVQVALPKLRRLPALDKEDGPCE